MPGLAPAQILAGRLQSEGIPAYAWQEGAGQATGLVVGLLGAGRVMVPEEFGERALEILSEEFDSDEEE
jgi:Putative prokaryotic signal transducing protein